MGVHSGSVTEVVNRNLLVSAALRQGYVAFLPVYDPGIDLILLRERDGRLLKVQLKSRWTIDRRYEGRDLWIAFPVSDEWYVAPHDEMMRRAPRDLFQTVSWRRDGAYSTSRPSAKTLEQLEAFRLTAVLGSDEGSPAVLPPAPDRKRWSEWFATGVGRSLAQSDRLPFGTDEILALRDEGRRS